MRSDAVQDPIFLPAVRSIEHRVTVPVDEQDPVQNFKRQFSSPLAKKARVVHQWNQSQMLHHGTQLKCLSLINPSPPLQVELLCMPAPVHIKEETNWPDSRVF
jgi:hypothetical protein